jgi:hypothetical protein
VSERPGTGERAAPPLKGASTPESRLLFAMAFWLGFGLGATVQSCFPHLAPTAPTERR